MDDDSENNERIQALLNRRGQDLVRGFVEEFQSLHRQIAGLKRELAALADYQTSRWLVLEAAGKEALPLPRVAAIEPDQLLRPRDGFYAVEYTVTGVPFRWTGPSVQFSFDVFVDRSYGADLWLQALNCMSFDRQKTLSLLVDGETVPVTVTQEGVGFTLSAILPARADRRSTNIVFVLPAVFPPPKETDTRQLGIAFGRLSVLSRTADSVAGKIDATRFKAVVATPSKAETATLPNAATAAPPKGAGAATDDEPAIA